MIFGIIMAMILPSKKVLSIFVLTAALVAAIIIAFGKDKSSSAINFTNNLVAGEKISVPENPNWQNEFDKVNPNATSLQIPEASSTAETATDVISRTLVANYLALKQSGTLNQDSAQKLLDQTVNLVDQLGNKVVLDTKLNIISDNGKQTIADYGENLGTVLKNNRPTEIKNEITIINASIGQKDASKINELDSIIAVYEKIGSDLQKMPVPKIFVKAHLDMTNGLISAAIGLREIKNVFSDPIKSLSAIKLYQDGMLMFVQAKRATNVFLIKNSVVYKQGSGGYYLLYGL